MCVCEVHTLAIVWFVKCTHWQKCGTARYSTHDTVFAFTTLATREKITVVAKIKRMLLQYGSYWIVHMKNLVQHTMCSLRQYLIFLALVVGQFINAHAELNQAKANECGTECHHGDITLLLQPGGIGFALLDPSRHLNLFLGHDL